MRLDEEVTFAQAARILKVSAKTVQRMVRDGLLHPRVPEGKRLRSDPVLSKNEVYALLEARAQELDLATVATMAIRAHVSSRTSERLLEQLLQVLGVGVETLSLKEEDVLALYVRTKDDARRNRPFTAAEVRGWAQIFVGLTEEYLSLVQHYTADDEPWKPFLDLAIKISRERKPSDLVADIELKAAYGMFDYARRNLRAVAYFFVRSRHGKTVATQVFPETNDVHDQILAFAQPWSTQPE